MKSYEKLSKVMKSYSEEECHDECTKLPETFSRKRQIPKGLLSEMTIPERETVSKGQQC